VYVLSRAKTAPGDRSLVPSFQTKELTLKILLLVPVKVISIAVFEESVFTGAVMPTFKFSIFALSTIKEKFSISPHAVLPSDSCKAKLNVPAAPNEPLNE